jgi:hypothetical protein
MLVACFLGLFSIVLNFWNSIMGVWHDRSACVNCLVAINFKSTLNLDIATSLS